MNRMPLPRKKTKYPNSKWPQWQTHRNTYSILYLKPVNSMLAVVALLYIIDIWNRKRLHKWQRLWWRVNLPSFHPGHQIDQLRYFYHASIRQQIRIKHVQFAFFIITVAYHLIPYIYKALVHVMVLDILNLRLIRSSN